MEATNRRIKLAAAGVNKFPVTIANHEFEDKFEDPEEFREIYTT